MDPKLILKPIELIDIGIDKLTKIPVPILNENIVSTFDNVDGVPINSFNFTIDSNIINNSLYITIIANYMINLFFNYGDGYTETIPVNDIVSPFGAYVYTIQHNYIIGKQYNVSAFSDLDRITLLNMNSCGIISASLNNLKKLTYLDLSYNLLTTLNIEGMIYLQYILLNDNYLYNDDVDDIYNTADTILPNPSTDKQINTKGTYNGTPSTYSSVSIENLKFKGWKIIKNE